MGKFVMIITICLCFFSCITNHSLPYKEIERIIHSERNDDGTRNFHLVDSIPYDSTKFVVVGKKEYTKYFFISKDYLKEHHQIKDKDVFGANFGVFKTNFSESEYFGYYHKDEEYQTGAYILCPLEGDYKGWEKIHFNIPPLYFRVYLARAKEYYVLKEMSGFDDHTPHRPYCFPDKCGYYKIYVPVWK